MSDLHSNQDFQVDNAIANIQNRITQFSNEYLIACNDRVQQQYYAIEDSFGAVLDGQETPQNHLQLVQNFCQQMMDQNFETTQFLVEAQYVFGKVLERHRDTLSRLYGILYDLDNPYSAESPEVQQLMHNLRTDWARELDKLTAQKDAEIVKLSKELGIWLLDDPQSLILSLEG